MGVLLLACTLLGCGTVGAPEVKPGHLFRATTQPVISSPVAYDWNGDATKEIAFGSWDGYFYLVDSQLKDLPGWPQHSPQGFFSSPALVDLDGDGSPEIVAGSDAGKLFAWNSDGSAVAGFPVELGGKVWASPTVLAGPRIAIGTTGEMLVVEPDGRPAAGWPQPLLGWPDATAARANGLVAVTTLTPGDPSRGWVYAWHEDGTRLPGFPVELPADSDSSPALADLDDDGRFWLVFGDDAGWLHVLDTGGKERSGFPVRTAGVRQGPTPTPAPPGGNVHSIEASPAVADLNGDGRLEIAVGSWDGRMYAWDDRGHALPGWPVSAQDQIISSAAVVDLNGDGAQEILVGSKDGHVYSWTAEGRTLPGFPLDLGSPVFSSPWVGDLEGDGWSDVLVGANDGLHLLTHVGRLGRAAWPMFHRNESHSGAASDGH